MTPISGLCDWLEIPVERVELWIVETLCKSLQNFSDTNYFKEDTEKIVGPVNNQLHTIILDVTTSSFHFLGGDTLYSPSSSIYLTVN